MDLDPFAPIIPMLCKHPKIAGHALCGPTSSSPKKTIELLVVELEQWEDSLQIAEYSEGFSEHAHKLGELRGKIGNVRKKLSMPLEYAQVFEDGRQLLEAVRRIQQIDPRSNPVAAARAYGAALKSFGRLVEKLPPPADAVGSLIVEMGVIFHQVVANMQPEVHIKGDNKRILDEDPTP